MASKTHNQEEKTRDIDDDEWMHSLPPSRAATKKKNPMDNEKNWKKGDIIEVSFFRKYLTDVRRWGKWKGTTAYTADVNNKMVRDDINPPLRYVWQQLRYISESTASGSDASRWDMVSNPLLTPLTQDQAYRYMMRDQWKVQLVATEQSPLSMNMGRINGHIGSKYGRSYSNGGCAKQLTDLWHPPMPEFIFRGKIIGRKKTLFRHDVEPYDKERAKEYDQGRLPGYYFLLDDIRIIKGLGDKPNKTGKYATWDGMTAKQVLGVLNARASSGNTEGETKGDPPDDNLRITVWSKRDNLINLSAAERAISRGFKWQRPIADGGLLRCTGEENSKLEKIEAELEVTRDTMYQIQQDITSPKNKAKDVMKRLRERLERLQKRIDKLLADGDTFSTCSAQDRQVGRNFAPGRPQALNVQSHWSSFVNNDGEETKSSNQDLNCIGPGKCSLDAAQESKKICLSYELNPETNETRCKWMHGYYSPDITVHTDDDYFIPKTKMTIEKKSPKDILLAHSQNVGKSRGTRRGGKGKKHKRRKTRRKKTQKTHT